MLTENQLQGAGAAEWDAEMLSLGWIVDRQRVCEGVTHVTPLLPELRRTLRDDARGAQRRRRRSVRITPTAAVPMTAVATASGLTLKGRVAAPPGASARVTASAIA